VSGDPLPEEQVILPDPEGLAEGGVHVCTVAETPPPADNGAGPEAEMREIGLDPIPEREA
jgi:hypothetical protein